MLWGRQGVGKSSLVAQMAHSFITGEPWLGFEIGETGPVVWLQFDMAVEETRRLIERAQDSGMDFQEQLYIVGPEDDGAEQVPAFNIYNEGHRAALKEAIRQIQPVAVILDTTDDGYETPRHLSVTEVARDVVKKYRSISEHAAFIFLRHERKKPSFGKQEDDPDAFSGPKDWEAVASSSLQIASKAGGYVLRVRKSRIDKAPFDELALVKDGFGFFQQKNDHVQMLQTWPGCLPVVERKAVVARISSKNDVFKDIAFRTGVPFETVKKAAQRAKGVDFPWISLVK